MHAEDYVHRIGRTGRAHREGKALTLVSELDGPRVAQIEAMLGHDVRREIVEGFAYAPFQKGPGRRDGGRSGSGSRRASSDRGGSGGRKSSGGRSRGRRRAGGGIRPLRRPDFTAPPAWEPCGSSPAVCEDAAFPCRTTRRCARPPIASAKRCSTSSVKTSRGSKSWISMPAPGRSGWRRFLAGPGRRCSSRRTHGRRLRSGSVRRTWALRWNRA